LRRSWSTSEVSEHLLPQRGLLQRLLRLLLAPLQVLGQPIPFFRIVERRQLRLHGHRQMLGRRTYLGDDMVTRAVVLARQHLVAQEVHNRREVRLLVELLVVELNRMTAQH
jgi:hypothetical protein